MSYLPDSKMAACNLGNMLVLGLGVSGKAVVEYALPLLGERIETLTVMGGNSGQDVREWASALEAQYSGKGITFLFDSEDVQRALPRTVAKFDICIASPGISVFSDFYRNAQEYSNAVVSEVEFAWRESSSNSVWVAVTGTNGKTTTTALLAHILAEAGHSAKAIGNIGEACIRQIAQDKAYGIADAWYVVETSSYQLASIDRFAPDAAVILGITPDHIKWHKTHEHYVASKFKLLSNVYGSAHAFAVLDATNDEVRAKVRELRGKTDSREAVSYVPLGTSCGIGFDMRKACGSENAAFVNEDDALTVAMGNTEHVLCNVADLHILGVHNQINALAAASAALGLGVSEDAVMRALMSFKPLEHRIEPCGEARGILYFNDSKATNVDATLQALRAFLPKKPIVMLGGDDKGTDLAELLEACRVCARAIVCYGDAGPRFYEALKPLDISSCQGADGEILANKCSKSSLDFENIPVIIEQTFDKAFQVATAVANPGDIVLLSPACASFDEFTCFEERGEHFKQLVAQMRG